MRKPIALCVKGGRITADIFKAALVKLMRAMDERKRKTTQTMSQAARLKDTKTESKDQAVVRGKKTLKQMTRDGSELTNIEITGANIKSFEKVARKYSIDYSLKKDKSVDPLNYYVFFRAKDADVMTAAFKEYTGVTLKRSKKVSIRKKLAKAIEMSRKHRERAKVKEKTREPER